MNESLSKYIDEYLSHTESGTGCPFIKDVDAEWREIAEKWTQSLETSRKIFRDNPHLLGGTEAEGLARRKALRGSAVSELTVAQSSNDYAGLIAAVTARVGVLEAKVSVLEALNGRGSLSR